MTQSLALYIHWPFCKFKCPYCDFNSHVRERVEHRDWRAAYLKEMKHYRGLTGAREIESVFFGGGTPSLMEPETVAAVIKGIDDLWGLPANTEVTLEANPTSVEAGKLQGFKSAGVNRVSLGVQSLRDEDLKKLGRQHSAAEAVAAVKTAAKIFDRYTFDLIYARPDQTPDAWEKELNEALEFTAGHMSLYQLTIEEGTQYHTLHARGELKVPSQDEAATLYEMTQDIMAARGMPAYEISNHAAKGQESRHNLAYWRYHDYAGVGPGAHGRLTLNNEKHATRAHRAPELWLERVEKHGHGAHPFEDVPPEKRMTEMAMMGLRLTDGIPFAAFERETGKPLLEFLDAKKVEALKTEGLLHTTDNALLATAAGRQKLNAVLAFLAA
jgi:putative oxygen-independent coproporphyrinogen III oxidase